MITKYYLPLWQQQMIFWYLHFLFMLSLNLVVVDVVCLLISEKEVSKWWYATFNTQVETWNPWNSFGFTIQYLFLYLCLVLCNDFSNCDSKNMVLCPVMDQIFFPLVFYWTIDFFLLTSWLFSWTWTLTFKTSLNLCNHGHKITYRVSSLFKASKTNVFWLNSVII